MERENLGERENCHCHRSLKCNLMMKSQRSTQRCKTTTPCVREKRKKEPELFLKKLKRDLLVIVCILYLERSSTCIIFLK